MWGKGTMALKSTLSRAVTNIHFVDYFHCWNEIAWGVVKRGKKYDTDLDRLQLPSVLNLDHPWLRVGIMCGNHDSNRFREGFLIPVLSQSATLLQEFVVLRLEMWCVDKFALTTFFLTSTYIFGKSQQKTSRPILMTTNEKYQTTHLINSYASSSSLVSWL